MTKTYMVAPSKRRCVRCHIEQNALEFLVKDMPTRICNTCRYANAEQEKKDRINARRRELAALAREMKREAKYKARILTQPLNKLKHTVERINTILNESEIESIEMPPAVTTAREVVFQNKVLRELLSEYLRLTRLNRNQLRQLSYNEAPNEITRQAIQRRKYMQQIAAEALKMSLSEYLRGEPYHEVHTHYGELVSIYRAI